MQWTCKAVNPQQCNKEIKTLPDLERVNHIYTSMVEIGHQGQQVANKGQAQVVQTMKQLACEHIPSGEELHSVVCDKVFTISSWCAYAYDTPDICLENERQWPDEPDLIY